MRRRRAVAVIAAASLVASCAHISEGSDPEAMTIRIVRDACLPFVLEGASVDDVGRNLGGWWGREWPDPFSPVPGTDFTRGGVTLSVDDGREARQMNGERFPDPVRSCFIWMPAQGQDTLARIVRAAISDRPELSPVASDPHPTVRTLACGRRAAHRVVVQVRAVADDRSGVLVREVREPPAGCAA